MKVSDLLKRLALGELSNLSLAEGGEIVHEKRATIMAHANEGLLRLHTRFVLRERNLLIRMRDGITFYHLRKQFAQSNYDPIVSVPSWDVPYILDLPHEPFEEDVIKILSIYDHEGTKLPINDLNAPNSVFVPQAKMIQVPHVLDGRTLSVEYQAKHPELVFSHDFDQEIGIPDTLEAALTAFIAYKIFSHMNTQENTAKGQEHAMLFETLCQDAVDMDLVNSSVSTTNNRFEIRGFM